jgi:hypothetical protein
MDWPVIGSVAGVAALAGSVAVGGWLMLGSTTMAIKNPSAPVLLVDTKPPQQSVLYLPPQVRTAQRESVLASVPRSDLLEPYSDRDRPYRRAPVTQHEEISKKPKAYVATRHRRALRPCTHSRESGATSAHDASPA